MIYRYHDTILRKTLDSIKAPKNNKLLQLSVRLKNQHTGGGGNQHTENT